MKSPDEIVRNVIEERLGELRREWVYELKTMAARLRGLGESYLDCAAHAKREEYRALQREIAESAERVVADVGKELERWPS